MCRISIEQKNFRDHSLVGLSRYSALRDSVHYSTVRRLRKNAVLICIKRKVSRYTPIAGHRNKLELIDSRALKSGLIILRYKVQ